MIPILDTHQHLWDLNRFHLPWLERGGPLTRDHVMDDYLTATQDLNVVRTIYMEVDVEGSQQVAEAEYVFDLCRRADNPMVGAVIGGRPDADDFIAYIDRFKDNPAFKGVRQVLHGAAQQGHCLERAFVRGIRALGERGLRFDLCMRADELLDAAELAVLCPDTRFILDHCGNAEVQAVDRSQWRRDIEEVARCKNVVCKISGIVASAKPFTWSAEDLAPIILHCTQVFGHDRIMFGSDWPVCTLKATYAQWVEALESIVSIWSEENKRKLFHDNAMRFYNVAAA